MGHTARLSLPAFIIAVMSVIGVTYFDYLVGKELLTSIFDILPVAYVAYYGSRRQAIFLAIFSALLWSTVPCPSR